MERMQPSLVSVGVGHERHLVGGAQVARSSAISTQTGGPLPAGQLPGYGLAAQPLSRLDGAEQPVKKRRGRPPSSLTGAASGPRAGQRRAGSGNANPRSSWLDEPQASQQQPRPLAIEQLDVYEFQGDTSSAGSLGAMFTGQQHQQQLPDANRQSYKQRATQLTSPQQSGNNQLARRSKLNQQQQPQQEFQQQQVNQYATSSIVAEQADCHMIAHKPATSQQHPQMRASQPPLAAAGPPIMHNHQIHNNPQAQQEQVYYQPAQYSQQPDALDYQHQQQVVVVESQRYVGAGRGPPQMGQERLGPNYAQQGQVQYQSVESAGQQQQQVPPPPYHSNGYQQGPYAEQAHAEQIPMQPQQHHQHQHHHHHQGHLRTVEAQQTISQQALPTQQMVRQPQQAQHQHQLIHHHHQQRISPYHQSQQQPVRPSMNQRPLQAAPSPVQQYKQQQQPQAHHTPMSILSTNYQQVSPNGQLGYHQPAAFVEQSAPLGEPRASGYASNSPTLLQQQLNRQAGRPALMQPQPQQQRALPPAGMMSQQPQQASQGQKRRYEQAELMDPVGYMPQEQRQRLPARPSGLALNEPPQQQQQQQQQYYAPQARASGGQPSQRLVQAAPASLQMGGPPSKRLGQHPHPMEGHQGAMLGNPTPPLTPTAANGPIPQMGPQTARILQQPLAQPEQQWHHHGELTQQPPVGLSPAQMQAQQPQKILGHEQAPLGLASHPQRPMPKNNNNLNQANFQPYPAQAAPLVQPPVQPQPQEPPPSRLTLPLRDANLLGPFKLDHEAHFISKVFHLKQPLFETLNKSLNMMLPQTATVVHELQFRAYLVSSNQNKQQHNNCGFGANASGDSLLASNSPQQAGGRACNWPELFQVFVNQNALQLDRSKGAHKAIDIFQFCQLGDNVIEIQVSDCYCNHEFLIEAVERPTLKAFMNSCYKSRQLQAELCLNKLRCNFGQPGFLVQQPALAQQPGNPLNEYISMTINEFSGEALTKAKISLKCPLGGRRIRTPARGANCKHLQCFDLENFLAANRERTQWSCPLCLLPVPFPSLELDQHQMNLLQSLPADSMHEEILMEQSGQWQTYSSNYAPCTQLAKSSGIYHPQQAQQQPPQQAYGAASQQPLRPLSGPSRPALAGSPGWEPQQQPQQVQRPLSAQQQQPGRPSANGSPQSKKPFQPAAHNFNQQQVLARSHFEGQECADELSPLAAMERAIHQHEQQMGPPPFDPNSLAAASPAGQPSRGAPVNAQPPPQAQQQLQLQHPAQNQSNQPEMVRAQFSPAQVASPRLVPASPQQQQATLHPQSPKQLAGSQQTSISTPATPSSSSILVQGGPETPATPSNSGPNAHQPLMSSHVAGNAGGVDHQPLSNGSASAGSITSSSTLTPSGQSIGSVGLGGDSRCNTAPLQNGNSLGGLDDLIQLAAGGSAGSGAASYASKSASLEEKSDILMSKLMMDSGESLLMPEGQHQRAHNEHSLELALEEAEWKQQQLEVTRGKSQHLANFLNEPALINHSRQKLSQYQSAAGRPQPLAGDHSGAGLLSGALDDELTNHSPGAGSDSHNLADQLDKFPNYLDAADNGAGLPPDESILDLFER